MWIILTENIKRKKTKKTFFNVIDFSNLYINISIFIFIFWLILFSSFVFYKYFFINNVNLFFWKVIEYNTGKSIINWDWKNFKWLKNNYIFLKDVEKKIKKISENKQWDLVWKLNFALPDVLDKEFVIKFFEDLFLTISSKDYPVILNSVNVWSASSNTISKWRDDKLFYRKYPISLWFSSSDKNFDRILDIIQVSWLFNKKYYFRWEILPVMTVSSIAMNFNDKEKWNNDKNNNNQLKWRSLQLFMYSYWNKNDWVKK